MPEKVHALKRLAAFFLKPYRERPLEERKRYEALAAILAIVAAVCLALPLIIDVVEVRWVTGAIALIFAVFLVLLRAGKAKAVGIVVGPVLSLLFLSIVFVMPYQNGLELYMMGCTGIFVIVLASLIASAGWQPLVCAFILSGGLATDFFARVLPGQLANKGMLSIDDFCICLVLAWVSAGVSSALINRNKRLVRSAESEAENSRAQLASIEKAIEAARETLDLGSRLTESSKSTSSIIGEIGASLASAKNEMGVLDAKARNLSESLNDIASGSGELRRASEGESAVVNQTSAAITEMTASIQNIASITGSRRESIARLTSSTEEGRREMDLSTKAVNAMEASAANILDIVKVINSVASQTNLLAMNAAIEAAHAGEYGRGFSVVADEIRALSEQTGKNVKAVGTTIKETIRAMKDAASANDSARSIFAKISDEAKAVADAMEEIVRGLEEISGGTAEITRGVESSVSMTNGLNDGVGRVDARIAEAVAALNDLTKASALALAGIDAVRVRCLGLAVEAGKVSEIGEKNEAGLKKLSESLLA